jgi:hypothetical protein
VHSQLAQPFTPGAFGNVVVNAQRARSALQSMTDLQRSVVLSETVVGHAVKIADANAIRTLSTSHANGGSGRPPPIRICRLRM